MDIFVRSMFEYPAPQACRRAIQCFILPCLVSAVISRFLHKVIDLSAAWRSWRVEWFISLPKRQAYCLIEICTEYKWPVAMDSLDWVLCSFHFMKVSYATLAVMLNQWPYHVRSIIAKLMKMWTKDAHSTCALYDTRPWYWHWENSRSLYFILVPMLFAHWIMLIF